jgi:hypothetical protein
MNEKNLIKNSERTPSELREMTRKGGINSGKARRQKRTMKEILTQIMQIQMKDKNGNTLINPTTGEKGMTFIEASMVKLMAKAANGDIKSIELIRKILGEDVIKQDITIKSEQPLFGDVEDNKES